MGKAYDLSSGNHETIVNNRAPIKLFDAEIFYWEIYNFDPLLTQEAKVLGLHPRKNMNIWRECHGYPSNSWCDISV